jgi:hypothetical protein
MNAPMSPELRQELIETKQFTGKALKLMKLLGAGCTQVEASKACGVDESYTAQLMADAEFKAQVDELIKKAFETQSAIDQNYISIEEKLSKRLLGSIEHEFNPDRILRTLKFVNEAKKKVAPTVAQDTNGSGANVQVAVLVLPAAMAPIFVKNPQGEVISVDGQVLTTLPSKTMDAFAEQNTKLKHEKMRQLTAQPNSNGSGHSDPYADL